MNVSPNLAGDFQKIGSPLVVYTDEKKESVQITQKIGLNGRTFTVVATVHGDISPKNLKTQMGQTIQKAVTILSELDLSDNNTNVKGLLKERVEQLTSELELYADNRDLSSREKRPHVYEIKGKIEFIYQNLGLAVAEENPHLEKSSTQTTNQPTADQEVGNNASPTSSESSKRAAEETKQNIHASSPPDAQPRIRMGAGRAAGKGPSLASSVRLENVQENPEVNMAEIIQKKEGLVKALGQLKDVLGTAPIDLPKAKELLAIVKNNYGEYSELVSVHIDYLHNALKEYPNELEKLATKIMPEFEKTKMRMKSEIECFEKILSIAEGDESSVIDLPVKNSADADVIELQHEYGGQKLEKETVVRLPQKSRLEAQCRQRIDILDQKIQEAKNNPVKPALLQWKKLAPMEWERQVLSKRLEKLEVDQLVKDLGGCFGSNYQRSYVKREALKIMRANNGKITTEQLKEIVDSTSPGLINARFDFIRGLHLLRVGVMSDLRNGSVSLKELQDILEEREFGASPTEARIKERLERLREKHGKKPLDAAALDLALKELENPEEALRGRNERMDTLMLQYIEAQVESKSKQGELANGSTLEMVDVRLLNPKTRKMEDGNIIDEKVYLEDMQAKFAEYNGKKIVFDEECKAPYRDDDGNIHLPAKKGEGKEVTIGLELMNVSVQRHKKNDGIQQIMNGKAMAQLENKFPKLKDNHDWKRAKELLDKGISNSEVAECLVSALAEVGVTVSLGCFSAKDRTGYVVARVMIKKMIQKLDPAQRKKAKKELTGEALKEGSVVMNVINENKKQRAAQFDPVSAVKDAGLAAGLNHLRRAARDKINPLHK